MPIFDEIHSQNLSIVIWKTEEPEEELFHLIPEPFHKQYAKGLDKIGIAKRRKEWLTARVILHSYLGNDSCIAYFPTGRPYLSNSDTKISISHTTGYVALALGKQEIGMDIESDKRNIIRKIASRVFSPEEYTPDSENRIINSKDTHTEQMIRWSSKESLYKLFDYTGADFQKHLIVPPFQPSPTKKGIIISKVRGLQKEETVIPIHYKIYPTFVLTYAALSTTISTISI